MSEHVGDRLERDATLHHLSRRGVPERVRPGPMGDHARPAQGSVGDVADGRCGERTIGGTGTHEHGPAFRRRTRPAQRNYEGDTHVFGQR